MGLCRQIWGLALVLMGVLGVCLACGLPLWREASFVGSNIVTAQSIWDGLWLHCIHQATGQIQCKRHTTSITVTSDIQAGRALTLLSILAGLLGFMVALFGGGIANCRGAPRDPLEPRRTSSSRKKFSLLGGALCVLAGILCLISASWSAAVTIMIYNDPMITAAMKREVGTSIYVGWASSLLLLLGGALISFVSSCEKERYQPPYRSYTPYTPSTPFINSSSHKATVGSDGMRSYTPSVFDRHSPRKMVEHVAQVHSYNYPSTLQSGVTLYEEGDFGL